MGKGRQNEKRDLRSTQKQAEEARVHALLTEINSGARSGHVKATFPGFSGLSIILMTFLSDCCSGISSS